MRPWKMQKGKLTPILDLPDDGLLYDIGYKTRGSNFKDGHWLVYHYITQIVYFAKDYVILDAGGYRSESTMKKINFYCKPMGITVKSEDKEWLVCCRGESIEFKDGMMVRLTGKLKVFNYAGCTEDLEAIKLRDKVLNDARKSLDKEGSLPALKARLMAQYAGYVNSDTAVESLEHELIFREFSKKCHHTLPKLINTLKEIDNV